MSAIPREIQELAFDVWNTSRHEAGGIKQREAIALALMDAEKRGRRHGPMICTSCGTVTATDECDCTKAGMERLSMRVRYIDFLLSEINGSKP